MQEISTFQQRTIITHTSESTTEIPIRITQVKLNLQSIGDFERRLRPEIVEVSQLFIESV